MTIPEDPRAASRRRAAERAAAAEALRKKRSDAGKKGAKAQEEAGTRHRQPWKPISIPNDKPLEW